MSQDSAIPQVRLEHDSDVLKGDTELIRGLLERVRAGDGEAARMIVDQFEFTIRVAVRARLTDPRWRRQFDSMDVCQSVLLSFFVRVGLGQYDIEDRSQLTSLLIRMAQNKLASRVRAGMAGKRNRANTTSLLDGMSVTDRRGAAADPLRVAMGKETLDRARAMMTPMTRTVEALRSQGASWQSIAARLGGTVESRRKQYERELIAIAERLESE